MVGSTCVTLRGTVAAVTVTDSPGGAPAPSSPCRSMYHTPGVDSVRIKLALPDDPDACSVEEFSVGNTPGLASRSTPGSLRLTLVSALSPTVTWT